MLAKLFKLQQMLDRKSEAIENVVVEIYFKDPLHYIFEKMLTLIRN